MAQKKLEQITKNIIERSKKTREAYLERLSSHKGKIQRKDLACANLAHAYASIPSHIKDRIKKNDGLNYAIVSAYNDMLSAHQPFKNYPDLIALSNTIAHRRGASCKLCKSVMFENFFFNEVRVVFERLVSGEHIIIS